jgi:hypothetical protein
MSRKFTLLAAACAITALVGIGSGAQAQSQSDMVPPGGNPAGGASRSMSPATMPGSAMAPRHHSMGRRAAMHRERRAMRREMRADRRAAQNPDAAYMGGGAVYERMPDGSMRPVM